MTGFREQGCGVPLTLLHGISSGAASWHKQMALPGYRVLAWDMPGYGESPMLAAAPANAGDYADALARMLDRAGVEQTILVGHSRPPSPRNTRRGCFTWCSPTSRRATARRKPHSGKKSGRGVNSR